MGCGCCVSTGSALRARPVHEQVEQAAGLVAAFRVGGGERHAAEADQHVVGADVLAQRARRGPGRSNVVTAAVSRSLLCENGSPPEAMSARSPPRGREYALDPDAAARLWQVSVETLAG